MEKILNLSIEALLDLETIEPAIAGKIKTTLSAIVAEAQTLHDKFTLAVASVGKGSDAISPSPKPPLTDKTPEPTPEVASKAAPEMRAANHVRADGTSVQVFN